MHIIFSFLWGQSTHGRNHSGKGCCAAWSRRPDGPVWQIVGGFLGAILFTAPSSLGLVTLVLLLSTLPHALDGYSISLRQKSPCYLHAVKCGTTASHNAVAVGTEAALLWEGAVALGQKLAAQPQVLFTERGVVAGFGVVPQQLAASADVLCAELREVWGAVSVVPARRVGASAVGYCRQHLGWTHPDPIALQHYTRRAPTEGRESSVRLPVAQCPVLLCWGQCSVVKTIWNMKYLLNIWSCHIWGIHKLPITEMLATFSLPPSRWLRRLLFLHSSGLARFPYLASIARYHTYLATIYVSVPC